MPDYLFPDGLAVSPAEGFTWELWPNPAASEVPYRADRPPWYFDVREPLVPPCFLMLKRIGEEICPLQAARAHGGPQRLPFSLDVPQPQAATLRPVTFLHGTAWVPTPSSSWPEVLMRTSYFQLYLLSIKMARNKNPADLLIC